MSSVFEAVSDQTRRRLLDALRSAEGEQSVSELVEQLGVSQPTVSKHLKVLREHGLVEVREDGQRRFYSLNATALEPLREWVEEYFPTQASTVAEAAEPQADSARALPESPRARAAGRRLGSVLAVLTTPVRWLLRRG
ncbi:ArsR/SmtB family transcription factor [Pseudoclavibacter soli]|jgi:DNA-binding transcriptional ArsR family regulator|uniref:ArsR/SmtB family transcription factor n=1 Tax=Pseudoclavibacter soli TaxID=452623 RepID=UPI0006872E3E|nr:metalloregulator ArsR/SmtB family transcription factor [Pseudoclavibacter soli]